MVSSISKLYSLINSFSSCFDELSIFKALKHANIYKRNGTETKTILTVIFLCFIIFHGINLFVLNIKVNYLIKTISIVFLIHISLTDCRRINAFIINDCSKSRKQHVFIKITIR